MERVHLLDPGVIQHVAFVAPIDLRLRARGHFETPVQIGQRLGIDPQLGADPWPSLGQIHFHPLVMADESVLGRPVVRESPTPSS